MRNAAARKCDLFFQAALTPDGWRRDVLVSVENGVIQTVTPNFVAGSARRLGVALPGMPNLHSHAFQRGMAGLAEAAGPGPDSFWSWREIMYRFVDRITPDILRSIAAFAYVEMLESGFTRVGEFHYLHHDRDGVAFADPAEMSAAILAAAADSGIALTHLPVFYAHSGFGGAAPTERQRRFITGIDGYEKLLTSALRAAAALPDTVVGIAPHSLRAVTPDELAALQALAGTGPVHIHVAEQMREVEDCLAWSGQRPVEWLLDHAAVNARWCLVHATHLTQAEVSGLARSRAVAGLCPVTEANLGDGIFPASSFVAQGGAYGIGSDSNVLIDAAEELRLLEYGQRLSLRRRNIMAPAEASTGETLFRAALVGGAQALGGAAGIAPGMPADIVSLNMGHVAMAGRTPENCLDGLVFAGARAAIDGVWRRGEPVVEAGRHRNRDRIETDYRQALAVLLN
ncbi:formimidoylglutamate deiminase [Sphingobium sp.]|uniref:formimidoylglutamate deiminase n=1 Tax=Sphingobium sp. TaxID=1912891 RepID=UPI002C5B5F8F|nr:formimidoylglutamate deiminase [Sphingobium sp.]HUD92999.1 formimidoylglutamate deiminase [Sphingobium sp.]